MASNTVQETDVPSREAETSELSRRQFVSSVIGVAAAGAALQVLGTRTAEATEQALAPTGRVEPTAPEPLVVHVRPRALRTGDILITDQFNSKIYLFRDREVLPFIDVATWNRSHLWDTVVSPDRRRMYVSMSGIRGPALDYVGIRGLAAVVEIDPEAGQVVRIFSSIDPNTGFPLKEVFVDPTGMAVTPDQKALLVNDFHGFATKGKVLRFDLATGDMSVLTTGLLEPAGLSLDGPNHVLIGNARMPKGKEFGGQIVRCDLATGAQEVLFNIDLQNGALIGALRTADGALIATLSDWPAQTGSAVLRVDGPHSYTELLQPKLAFFSAQIAPDPTEGFWVAESVTRRLYHMSSSGKVIAEVPVDRAAAGFTGPWQPLKRAFDTLESVRLVS